jgi:hypothetical protein
VALPEGISQEKSRQSLYPNDFLRLVSCETVRLLWRRAFTMATCLALRPGVLPTLAWDDLDLEHAVA